MDVDELLRQRDGLLTEVEEERIKRRRAEKLLQDAQKNLQGYLDELHRVAETSAELVTHLGTRQAEGDRLRVRLKKTLDCYGALLSLYGATVAGSPDVETYRATFEQAKLAAETNDG